MTGYIGTKELGARPMNLGNYNIYRGWTLPKNEKADSPGYLVEYSNTYQSWSPKNVFEESYCKNGELNFGHALFLLKQDNRLFRAGWNGKNMFIYLVEGSEFKVNRAPLNVHYAMGTKISYCPHIDMKTADGSCVPWVPSQSDMLAEDWGVIDNTLAEDWSVIDND